jgi:hypothetical protein
MTFLSLKSPAGPAFVFMLYKAPDVVSASTLRGTTYPAGLALAPAIPADVIHLAPGTSARPSGLLASSSRHPSKIISLYDINNSYYDTERNPMGCQGSLGESKARMTGILRDVTQVTIGGV